LERAGAEARSLVWIFRVVDGEWWWRIGVPVKKEEGVWDWWTERGLNDEAVRASWRTSIAGLNVWCFNGYQLTVENLERSLVAMIK